MAALRPRGKLSLSTHRGLEALVGAALVVVCFVSAAGSGAIPTVAALLGIAIGGLILTLGIADRRAGPALGARAHLGADWAVVAALVVLALGVAIAGDGLAAVFFVLMAIAQGLLTVFTGYGAAPDNAGPDAPLSDR